MKKDRKKYLRNRKQWVKTLDDLARRAVYARDGHRSVISGKTDNLNMAHVYPKGRYPRMRWDLDNLLTLSWNEHLEWAHKNPIDFTEWFKEKYPERYKRLRLISQTNYKTKVDYKLEEIYLKQMLKNVNDL